MNCIRMFLEVYFYSNLSDVCLLGVMHEEQFSPSVPSLLRLPHQPQQLQVLHLPLHSLHFLHHFLCSTHRQKVLYGHGGHRHRGFICLHKKMKIYSLGLKLASSSLPTQPSHRIHQSLSDLWNWEYATAIVHNQFWCGFTSIVRNDGIIYATPTPKYAWILNVNSKTV